MADILTHVYDFLERFIQPANIIQGWQNSATLPADSEEYAVITLIGAYRVGSNVETWTDGDEDDEIILNHAMLTQYDVQVDFCAPDYSTCLEQATALVTLARSRTAVQFFNMRGYSCQYADDLRSLPFTTDTAQWSARYSVTLHLSGWTDVNINTPAFTAVNVNLENVDVHHPV